MNTAGRAAPAATTPAMNYFKANPKQLIDLEHFITELVNTEIRINYQEIKRDYDEASYLNAFWANYPPEDRGRRLLTLGEYRNSSRLIFMGF